MGVSNNPDPVAPVRRIDGDSWYNKVFDFVTFTFQVSDDLLEYHALLDSKQSRNIFTDDPPGPELSNSPKHFRPEIAVIVRSFSSSGVAEWLAGESAGEEVNAPERVGRGFV